MKLFDHHIHSTRSDGTVSLEERATSVAVRPHGVSDHYPWRTGMQRDDDVLRYLDDAARLGLQVGLEYDLGVAPPLLRSTHDALDYVIGSVHQVRLDGVRVGYDIAGAHLKGRTRPPYSEAARFTDPVLQRRILEAHLALVRTGILETGIDIVGHPTMSPLAALGDPEARVRHAAAAALGQLGPVARDAVADLNLAVQDSDATVRRAATDALLRISDGGQP